MKSYAEFFPDLCDIISFSSARMRILREAFAGGMCPRLAVSHQNSRSPALPEVQRS